VIKFICGFFALFSGDIIMTSHTNGKLASIDEEYIFENWVDVGLKSPKAGSSIISGKTVNYKVNVNNGASSLEVDLQWKRASDKLTLSIYTPTGKNLGTKKDNSDKKTDGRIHLKISPTNGQIEQGTWQFEIYGDAINEKEEYTFNVYQH
jgi:hypothetical protein